jgi:hypothetical protein
MKIFQFIDETEGERRLVWIAAETETEAMIAAVPLNLQLLGEVSHIDDDLSTYTDDDLRGIGVDIIVRKGEPPTRH